ncbi:MAG: hypothetical protein AVDCRST_MAG10-2596, partial [uncultured Acidimicrobiales bacterium]
AHPRHHPVPAGRAVRPRGGRAVAAGADQPLRRAALCQAQGASRPSHRGCQGAAFNPGKPHRLGRRRPGRRDNSHDAEVRKLLRVDLL